MNWLAHTLLSKTHIDYQLGNILADPLKGVHWPHASEELIDGMQMHKAIDKFTDGHELLSVSKSRLGADGHLKGVVLDLLYDHYLSNEWKHFSQLSLEAFLSRFNDQAMTTTDAFPARPQHIVNRMVETNLLGKYQSFEGFEAALKRIDNRLSDRLKAKETASQYLKIVEQNYQGLLRDFNAFFPQLVDHFKQHPLGSRQDHFLR